MSRDLLALTLACWGIALVLYALVERRAYGELLGVQGVALARAEPWLLAWTIVGKTLLFLLPVLVVGVVLVRAASRRAGYGVFVAGSAIVCVLLGLDLELYAAFGKHLVDLLAFAALPRGTEVAGNTGRWVWLASKWIVLSGAVVVPLTWLASRASLAVQRRASQPLRRFLAGVALVVLVVLAAAPPFLAPVWRHQPFHERLQGSLPVDLRPSRRQQQPPTFSDPELQRLHRGLSEAYERFFPLVFAPKPTDERVVVTAERKRNVVLIVLESWRHDSLETSWMPRLTAWASRGLRLDRHYAGSVYSEAGLFALLYGRSPLVYHSTLDAGIPPELCEALRRSGYECAYFSGHPKVWMRREDYLNERTFDRFVHDDEGTWNDWDRRALSRMVDALATAGDEPVFAVAFLMSSHFEYQYPPEYERHTPVAASVKWHVTRLGALGAEDRVPLLNRYRNTLAFLDDVVSDAIDRLDPEQNLVIVTGDHGESLYDDGRYGHGYSFADILARVPMAIVGPGFEPERRDDLTLHVDLLPTVLHALEGSPMSVEHGHGRDLLQRGPARRSTLLAHGSVNRDAADALLLAGDRRLRLELDLRQPKVTLKGFEDELARPLPASGEPTDELIGAFTEQLSRVRR